MSMRLNIEKYRALAKIPRRNKYNAQKCNIDGFNFASKTEAAYFKVNKERVKLGELVYFLRQVPIHLPGGVKLVVDFAEFYLCDPPVFIDVKGDKPTREWITKQKMVQALYPIEIKTIKRHEVEALKKKYHIS